MTRVAVVGAGRIGPAVAYALARSRSADEVVLVDQDRERGLRGVRRTRSRKVEFARVDLRRPQELRRALRGCAAVVNAVGGRAANPLLRAALALGAHYCDLGIGEDVLRQLKRDDRRARRAGLSVVPNAGLAPGLANLLAIEALAGLEHVEVVHLMTGGLPQRPRPPLNYAVAFDLQGMLESYAEPVQIIREGRRTTVQALTELEELTIPPLGTLEAFQAGGELSCLPEMLEGKVEELWMKTIRYPGFCEAMRLLVSLGFASEVPIQVGGLPVRPRDFLAEALRRAVGEVREDVVVLQGTVRGMRQGRPCTRRFELLDRADLAHGLTAMMRTTGFPAAALAELQVEGGVIEPGVRPFEIAAPAAALRPRLSELGIKWRSWEEPVEGAA